MTLKKIRSSAAKLQQVYPNDMEDSFVEEFVQFTSLIPPELERNPIKMRRVSFKEVYRIHSQM